MYFYEPLLCPRCRSPITTINAIHAHPVSYVPCKAKKHAKGAFVYLMHDLTNDLLKIGYSEDPHRRHKELIHGSTNEIRLLGYFIGSKVNEHIVHSIFASNRLKREWFKNDTLIIDYFTGHPSFTN